MSRGSECVFAIALLLVACDEGRKPTGPPRCEPPQELILERALKRGYRALHEGRTVEARLAFQQVLDRASEHPEARAGIRTLETKTGQDACAEGHLGQIDLAGKELPSDLPIKRQRYRFEELRAQRKLMATMNRGIHHNPTPVAYRPRRHPSGEDHPVTDPELIRQTVDLLIIHATYTQTARESFLKLSTTQHSTHFTIDTDGTIFQNLDLAYEASHTGDAALDSRSLSVSLVNPVTLDKPPLPAGYPVGPHARPLSDFVRIHGEEVQQWGYTDGQMEALGRLVAELLRILPGIPSRLPLSETVGWEVLPRGGKTYRGIAGQLHLSPSDTEPGPGMDWERLRRFLR